MDPGNIKAAESSAKVESSLTFMGVFDDRLHKYLFSPDLPGVERRDLASQVSFVDETLFEAAIVGDPPLISDGYMLMTPALQASVVRQDSPLCVLGEAGYIKLACRQPHIPLSGLVDWGRDAGVTSFSDELPTDPEWRRQLLLALDLFHSRLKQANALVPFPRRDIGAGFVRFMETAFDKHREPLEISAHYHDFFKQCMEEFREAIETNAKAPRTQWEKIVQRLAEEKNAPPVATQLMRFANVAYHVNLAACYAASGLNVVPHTVLGPSFLEFLESSAPEDLAPLKEVQLPAVVLPKDAIDYSDGTKLRAIVIEGPLNAAKRAYREAIDAILLRRGDSRAACKGAEKSAREAAEEYSRRLCEHFGVHERGGASKTVITFALDLVHLVAHDLSLGIALILANHIFVPRFARMLTRRFLTEYEQFRPELWTSTVNVQWDGVGRIAAALASPQVNGVLQGIAEFSE